jgi:hypothetical protein
VQLESNASTPLIHRAGRRLVGLALHDGIRSYCGARWSGLVTHSRPRLTHTRWIIQWSGGLRYALIAESKWGLKMPDVRVVAPGWHRAAARLDSHAYDCSSERTPLRLGFRGSGHSVISTGP